MGHWNPFCYHYWSSRYLFPHKGSQPHITSGECIVNIRFVDMCILLPICFLSMSYCLWNIVHWYRSERLENSFWVMMKKCPQSGQRQVHYTGPHLIIPTQVQYFGLDHRKLGICRLFSRWVRTFLKFPFSRIQYTQCSFQFQIQSFLVPACTFLSCESIL